MTLNNLFYQKYQKLAKENYPSLAVMDLSHLPVSPWVIPVSADAVKKISLFIQLLYGITRGAKYREVLQTDEKDFLNFRAENNSLLMSYDFHLHEGRLHLIEVNTNSAGYLVSELVDRTHGKKNRALEFLKKSFQEEWCNWQGRALEKDIPTHALIVDEGVKAQKMYKEFLMYQDLLGQWGWPVQIAEVGDLSYKGEELVDSHSKKVDMVYNRTTDFYLKKYPALKKAFLNRVCCVSPHPVEYLLLADKSRLVEWSSEAFLKALKPSDKNFIQSVVPAARRVRERDTEYLWQNRKRFIFKPLRGYGGRGVYRGKSITRVKFKDILKLDYVYQTYVPPGTYTDPEGNTWKYDLRAYAYMDKLQHLTARLYRGQVTGFGEGGGFASVAV